MASIRGVVDTNVTFPILFTASLLSQLKYLTTSQLSSLMIKINELNPDEIFNNHSELITIAAEKCGLAEQLHRLSQRLNVHQAKERATQWLQNGIFVLFTGNQQVLFCQGNREILDSSTAAVLNSHKIRSVTPTTCWLKVTTKLTESAIEKGVTIVSSLGMLTYEIVTFIANRHNSPMIIVLDGYLPGVLSSDLRKTFYDKFSNMFDLKNTLFISPFWPEITLPVRRERMAIRDYWVVALAKKLFVAEARIDGNIQKLASTALSEGRKVAVFRPLISDQNTKGNQKLLLAGAEAVIYSGTAQSKPSYSSGEETPPLSIVLSEYLFHSTRACPSPWPEQTLSGYIQSLVENDLDAGHMAFDTLCRILKEQLIRAGNRLVRGKTSVVSFTTCLPNELAKIRKWNPALIRWTFEPYGIGIKKSILGKMGAKPVIYAEEEKFSQLPPKQQFRFQLHQPPKTDWSLEKEWRLTGDVILSHLSPENMIIVVSSPHESTIIRTRFSLPVILANVSVQGIRKEKCKKKGLDCLE
ncbi:MAG: DNA-processing protein DprA [Nitrospirota bacterium]